MTTYVSDSFTGADGTALSAHGPETGGAWSDGSAGVVLHSNKASQAGFAGASAYSSPSPVTADYSVTADISMGFASGSDFVAIGGRGAFSGFDNGYTLAWYGDVGEWQLRRVESGVGTVLDSFADGGFTAGVSRNVSLRLSGSSLVGLIDGVERLSATDSTYASAGVGFVRGNFAADFDLSIDNFVVADLGAPPGVHTVSGVGEVEISTPAWVSVSVSDIPASTGFGKMDPHNYWKLGTIAFGTNNGEMPPHQVIFAESLFEVPSGMTKLWYAFAPGTTATITERSSP